MQPAGGGGTRTSPQAQTGGRGYSRLRGDFQLPQARRAVLIAGTELAAEGVEGHPVGLAGRAARLERVPY